jgi:TrmH family RNA methyltransferase
MNEELITSPQNPKVKRLLELQTKSSARREAGLFVVEGARELGHCLGAGFEADTIFWCPEILPSLPFGTGSARIIKVSPQVYAKVACREGTEGIVAEIRSRSLSLGDLNLPDNPLICVLESVEKPGNLGAVLRSADAAGADAILICDPLTDLYNPNLIRASLGSVFTVPCVCCPSDEAIAFLKGRGIRILTAQLQDSSPYYDCDMSSGTAIVMGTESTGLTDIWRKAADAHIRIPMAGRMDSLNVSVSAAILLFEAVRQRNG